MKRRSPRRLGTAVLLLALLSCSSSPTRSRAAFCETFTTNAVRLHDKYQTAANSAAAQGGSLSSLIGSLGNLLSAQGDLVTLFTQLAQVAPSDIATDVAASRDALKAQASATRNIASNPLGAIAQSLIGGLQASGSFDRVNSYINQNCDLTQLGGSTPKT
jgi:hypothetical protein